MSPGDEHDGFHGVGGSGQTRTRLPEGNSGDVYGGARRPTRSSRSLITVVGVVVLLIAAIAFANRGEGDQADATPTTGTPGKPATTAATGTRPVTTTSGPLPTGFAHDEQGAQSAATNYAVALGSADMFSTDRRREIIGALAAPTALDNLRTRFDTEYSPDFVQNIGLNQDGTAPAGTTFVSRTIPVGAKVNRYSDETADVDIWAVGMFGLTGTSSTKPVTHAWFTRSIKLSWTGSDWKVLSTTQRTGPTPVSGDNPVSGSDEISDAVKEFGGFTYAR